MISLATLRIEQDAPNLPVKVPEDIEPSNIPVKVQPTVANPQEDWEETIDDLYKETEIFVPEDDIKKTESEKPKKGNSSRTKKSSKKVVDPSKGVVNEGGVLKGTSR